MLASFLVFLADAAPAASPAAGPNAQSPAGNMLMLQLAALAVIFYLLLIRPQQRRQKEQNALLGSVKIGDKVILSSGLHGLVTNVKEATILVKVADNVKMEFEKTAIAKVIKPETKAE